MSVDSDLLKAKGSWKDMDDTTITEAVAADNDASAVTTASADSASAVVVTPAPADSTSPVTVYTIYSVIHDDDDDDATAAAAAAAAAADSTLRNPDPDEHTEPIKRVKWNVDEVDRMVQVQDRPRPRLVYLKTIKDEDECVRDGR